MISISKYFSIIFDGVDLYKTISFANQFKNGRRIFRFYGVQIGWWMIGVTVAERAK